MVQAYLQIQGQGSTPFDTNNQNLIINAFASVMSTVTRADFTIRYFTSDDSKLSSFVSPPATFPPCQPPRISKAFLEWGALAVPAACYARHTRQSITLVGSQ